MSEEINLKFKTRVIEIEKAVAHLVGIQNEKMIKEFGQKLANEMCMSVSALLASRTIGMTHIWTGEKLDSVRKRFDDCVDADMKPTLTKLSQAIGRPLER